MDAYPHRYDVRATATPAGDATVAAGEVSELATAPPPQFGGRGGRWSPETLLVAAAADCFVLTFQAMAAASKLPWRELACDATGILDRADGAIRFTGLELRARLVLPAGGDVARATRLLEKAERGCLVTASLILTPILTAEVVVAD